MNEIVKQIAEATNPKYSNNLRRWLLKFLKRYGEMREIIVVKNLRTRRKYIGFFDGNLFVGSALGPITANGAREMTGAWGHSKDWKPIKNFWKRYCKMGVCLTDPEHDWYHERWEYLTTKRRKCKHCGLIQQCRKRRVTTVYDVWDSR